MIMEILNKDQKILRPKGINWCEIRNNKLIDRRKYMFFLPSFYDAAYNYKDSEYVIFGVPYDFTSSYRPGSRWAPDEIRKANLNFEMYENYYGKDLTDIPVHDAGNIDPSVSINDTLDEVYLSVLELLDDEKVPIMLGGEHSITYASVKACAQKIREREQKKNGENINFGCLVLDAHLDMRTEFRGVKYNHACVTRNIYREITKNIVMIGVRSGSKEEWEFMKDNNIPYYTADDVRESGLEEIIKEANEKLNTDNTYFSLDMDVLDPAYCPGLGTPEPFGLTSVNVRDIIRKVSPKTMAFDIVEISPEYDNGTSALLAAKFIKEYIFARERKT